MPAHRKSRRRRRGGLSTARVDTTAEVTATVESFLAKLFAEIPAIATTSGPTGQPFLAKYIKFASSPAAGSVTMQFDTDKVFRGFHVPGGGGGQSVCISLNGVTASAMSSNPEGTQLDGVIVYSNATSNATPQLLYNVKVPAKTLITMSKNAAAAVELFVYYSD